jgi:hypothetical protein
LDKWKKTHYINFLLLYITYIIVGHLFNVNIFLIRRVFNFIIYNNKYRTLLVLTPVKPIVKFILDSHRCSKTCNRGLWMVYQFRFSFSPYKFSSFDREKSLATNGTWYRRSTQPFSHRSRFIFQRGFRTDIETIQYICVQGRRKLFPKAKNGIIS